ncbi:MAG: hypothetical protein V2I82_03690 [Halieaceae bacterium]|jgi:hypothetical protein|nr:hypothetical protein [Halieaceae bacterium]
MLLPALLFLGGATMTLFGGGVLAALCLVPAGIAVDHAFRDAQRQPDES